MLNLIRNENMKIYKQRRTLFILIGLIFIVGFACYQITKGVYVGSDPEWKTGLTNKITTIQQTLDRVNKPGSDLQMPEQDVAKMRKELLADKYRIKHDIPPDYSSTWYTIEEAVLNLFFLITLFSLIITGDSVASEFSTGTIKLLAIRPISRTKILISKYIANLMFSFMCIVLTLATSTIMIGARLGFKQMDLKQVVVMNDHAVAVPYWISVWKGIGLSSITLLVVVTVAFLISSVFRSSAMAIGLSIAMLFLNMIFVPVLSQKFHWMKYYLFTNTDLTQYTSGTPFISGMTLTFSLTVLAIYYLGMIGLTWLIFNKRDIAV
jgi:ABC-2 type transport system permease protein